jgi:hypothetical protein
MSPDELSELEQLDRLALELAEAGSSARAGIDATARPDPAFAARLRSELVASIAADESRPAAPGVPLPPAHPAGLVERRHGSRPFTGARQIWAPEERPFGRRAEDREAQPDVHADRWLEPGRSAAAADADRPRTGTGAAETRSGPAESSLSPSVHWQIPTRLLPPRGLVAALAAGLAIVAMLFGSGYLWPVKASATADEAVAATLLRDGTTSPLAAGTALREGDEISVAAGGRAILTLGSSVTRLDAGAAIRIDSLVATAEIVSQLAGRVYHRVNVPAGGEYSVVTASVTWEAHGTAFDLDRHSTAGGGEQVVGLALQHKLDLTGPKLEVGVAEGNSATVTLRPDGSTAGAPAIAGITAAQLAGPWLASNAALDARLGLPLGLLAAVVVASPTPTPTAASETPVETVSHPTDGATAGLTDSPSARVTAKPQPTATPLGYLGKLQAVKNGDGTYTLSWPRYTGPGFEYYKVVYCAWSCTPSYPASDLLAAISSPSENTWTGPLPAGDHAFRVQVVDLTSGTVIRASSTVLRLVVIDTATPPPVVSLGALDYAINGDGTYTFSWVPYTGGQPFNYYKLVFEYTSSGRAPDYTTGSSYWAVPGTGDTTVTLTPGTGGFVPGDYQVRIQAIGYPLGPAYAYGQTAVLHFVLPAVPTPSPTVCTAAVGAPATVGNPAVVTCPSPSPV